LAERVGLIIQIVLRASDGHACVNKLLLGAERSALERQALARGAIGDPRPVGGRCYALPVGNRLVI
jgi:hypothetical protein